VVTETLLCNYIFCFFTFSWIVDIFAFCILLVLTFDAFFPDPSASCYFFFARRRYFILFYRWCSSCFSLLRTLIRSWTFIIIIFLCPNQDNIHKIVILISLYIYRPRIPCLSSTRYLYNRMLFWTTCRYYWNPDHFSLNAQSNCIRKQGEWCLLSGWETFLW
jgi:hypothetical protein